MKRTILASSVTALVCLGFAAPLLAAPPTATGMNQPSAGEKKGAAIKSAEKCLSDLLAFDSQMEKDGHWLGGSGYGYGYPMNGFYNGVRPPMMPSRLEATATPLSPQSDHHELRNSGYQNARPGYEVRMLFASANILAQHGQQQSCEDVLATTRDVYKLYVANLASAGERMVDVPGWRQQQIAAAEPVTSKSVSFRSDELLGTEVRNPQNEALGSIEDLVMSSQAGKIAYLVIGRGGVFGIDEKYVPVPWDDFKISPNVKLLVLDTTKAVLEAAPQVSKDQFATRGQFDQESEKVDAYWKAHLSDKTTNGSKN